MKRTGSACSRARKSLGPVRVPQGGRRRRSQAATRRGSYDSRLAKREPDPPSRAIQWFLPSDGRGLALPCIRCRIDPSRENFPPPQHPLRFSSVPARPKGRRANFASTAAADRVIVSFRREAGEARKERWWSSTPAPSVAEVLLDPVPPSSTQPERLDLDLDALWKRRHLDGACRRSRVPWACGTSTIASEDAEADGPSSSICRDRYF